MKKILGLFAGLLLAQAVAAGNLPYDETADAKSGISQALAVAQHDGKQVLLVFGANWCKDCRELDKALHGKTAALIDGKFVVVKIDVGNFDKNLDLAGAYGNPIKKGIPAAVVLTADNKVLYSTKGGELADARSMGDNGIYDFFSNVLPKKQ
jgi:protein disulfide-isomerase